jgi:hypothetical protein
MAAVVNKLQLSAFPLDGFDFSDTVFQMVPATATRDVVFRTEKFPAALKFSRPNVVLMGNFRDFDSKTPLPGVDAARFVNEFVLPANKKVQFTVKSLGAPGFISLTANDVATPDDITIEASLLLSVKPVLRRKFTFMFISDLVRTTVRGKIEPRFLLDPVKKVFSDQANIELIDIDSGGAFREVDVRADLGDPINLDDESKRKAIDARVQEVFPDLFSQTDFIVYVVWRVRGKHPKEKVLGMNVQTRDKLNTVYLSLEPTSGVGRVHTMAHEFGHAMGLPHAREDCLMFPTTTVLSNRLLGGHIEQLHTGPIFPGP